MPESSILGGTFRIAVDTDQQLRVVEESDTVKREEAVRLLQRFRRDGLSWRQAVRLCRVIGRNELCRVREELTLYTATTLHIEPLGHPKAQ